GVQPLDDLLDARRIGLFELDGDHTAVHVYGGDTAPLEQAPGQLVGRTIVDRLLGAGVPLVAHAGEHSVGLEAHDTGARRGLFDDGDRLTHDQDRTRDASPAATATHDALLTS